MISVLVLMAARRHESGTAVVERKPGGRAVANGDDISTWAGAERLIAIAVETFGDLHAV